MTIADLQREANFPLIAAATVLIDRKLRAGKYRRVLLSSRDCYMQARLWRCMFPATPYEICYWLTSRWVRLKPSESYLAYCRELIDAKTLVLDLCGTAESMRALFDRLGFHSDYLIVQSDPRKNSYRMLEGPGDLEGLNTAPHPMVVDVTKDGEPVYSNPLFIDWRQYFEATGGKVFFACCKRPHFSEFTDAPDHALLSLMRRAEQTIALQDDLLKPFHAMRKSEDWQ